MTVTAEATIEVPTVDLRRALKAAIPHAERNKTGDNSVEHRIRLCFERNELWVMATNGMTTGVAAIPIETDSRENNFEPDDGRFWADFLPKQARILLTRFPISSGAGDDMNEMIEIHATTTDLTFTDVGGLFPGDSEGFKQLPFAQTYPDLLKIVGGAIAQRQSAPSVNPLVAVGPLLAAFAPASKAYDAPVELYSTGSESSRGFTVAVGSSFVGLISSSHSDGDGMKRRDSSHRRWLERLEPYTPKLTAVSG